MCPDLNDLAMPSWQVLSRPDAPGRPEGVGAPRHAEGPGAAALEEPLRLALESLAEDLVEAMPEPPAAPAGAAAGPAAATGVAHPGIQRAIDGGRPRHAPPQPGFGPQLAELSAKLDGRWDELTHAQAKSLLKLAGVRHIDATHVGSTIDAALQSFLGQLFKLPLRLGAKSVLMIPDKADAAALAGTRTGTQAARGTAAVAVRQTRQPLSQLAFFGRARPTEVLQQLRLEQEAQLKRLIDNLALLRRESSASGAGPDLRSPAAQEALKREIGTRLQLHDDIEASAAAVEGDNRAVRQVSCITQQTRARMATAFAALAVDVLAKSGAHAALAGMDLGLLSQMVSLVTYPGMAALTKGICNWYDTKAIAGQMLLEYRQAVRAGDAPGDERLQAWSRWAQDHFQSAAQANFQRRDENVFQPALNDLLRQINETGYSLDRLHALAGAGNLAQYQALKQQQRVENRINQVNLKFDPSHLASHKADMELLLAFADPDNHAVSPDELKLLVRRDADVLLDAQGKQHQDATLGRQFAQFREAFARKCGAELGDADLKLLYKQLLGKSRVDTWDDLPACIRPKDCTGAPPALDPAGFLWTQGLRKNFAAVVEKHRLKKTYGLIKDRQQLERKLDTAKAQVTQVAQAPAGQPESEPETQQANQALRDKLAKVDSRTQALTHQQAQAKARYQSYRQQVDHYLAGEASRIDPQGEVGQAVLRHSHGVRAQFRRSFAPAALKKDIQRRLGLGVALPTALTALTEGSRLAVHAPAGQTRSAPPEQTATPTAAEVGAPRAGRQRRAAPVDTPPAPGRGWKTPQSADEAPRPLPERLPPVASDANSSSRFDQDALVADEARLPALAEFRASLAQIDVTDACVRLGLLPEEAQRPALDLMLREVDAHGRVAVMRNLMLLPEALRQRAAQSLLAGLGTAKPDDALAAAIAVLPSGQRRWVDARLTEAQRQDIDTPSADWPDRQPRGGASSIAEIFVASLQRNPEGHRDTALIDGIRKMGADPGVDFGHRQGEPLALLVKAIHTRPAASRSRLMQELVQARMSPAHQPRLADLAQLRGHLDAVQGVEPHARWTALTASIRHLVDDGERLQAYEQAFREVCLQREEMRSFRLPTKGAPQRWVRLPVLVPRISGDKPAESLKTLMDLAPSLRPQDQAEPFRQLGQWIPVLEGADRRAALQHWTSLIARLGAPDAERADALGAAMRQAGWLYRQDHIGRTIRGASPFLALMPEAIRGLSDADAQLQAFKALTGLFGLRTHDRGMQTGLTTSYVENEQVTHAHFAQIKDCITALDPGRQVDAVEHLARAIQRGDFDTAGCPNGGAASLRLDHFKSLAGLVSALPPAHKPEAMERLLSQAFAWTKQDMGYSRQPFQRWQSRNLVEQSLNEWAQNHPAGLDVKQESQLLTHLAQVLWPAEWKDANDNTGQLMRRIAADLLLRLKEQRGIDVRDAWVQHAIDSLSSGFSSADYPGKGLPNTLGKTGRPLVVIGDPGARSEAPGTVPKPPVMNQAGPSPASARSSAADAVDAPADAAPGAARPTRPAVAVDDVRANALKLARRRKYKPFVDFVNRMNARGEEMRKQKLTLRNRNAIDALEIPPFLVDKLLEAADRPIGDTVYRGMPGDVGDVQANGLSYSLAGQPSGGPALSEADRMIKALILHTGRTGGSGGEVMSFSTDFGVAHRFAKSKPDGIVVTVHTRPPEGSPELDPGFRSAAHLIATDGVRLVDDNVLQANTLLEAIRHFGDNSESEVFSTTGRIAPQLIAKAVPK